LSRKNLYILLLGACLAGYAWVFYHLQTTKGFTEAEVGFCIFKHTTGLPCPSCGSTRSVVSVFMGDLAGAFYWNPLGLIVLTIMVVAPLWIAIDVIRGKDSLHRFYIKAEAVLRKKWVAIPAIVLIIINWIWNFIKGL
jgi:hypothetical protein